MSDLVGTRMVGFLKHRLNIIRVEDSDSEQGLQSERSLVGYLSKRHFKLLIVL